MQYMENVKLNVSQPWTKQDPDQYSLTNKIYHSLWESPQYLRKVEASKLLLHGIQIQDKWNFLISSVTSEYINTQDVTEFLDFELAIAVHHNLVCDFVLQLYILCIYMVFINLFIKIHTKASFLLRISQKQTKPFSSQLTYSPSLQPGCTPMTWNTSSKLEIINNASSEKS